MSEQGEEVNESQSESSVGEQVAEKTKEQAKEKLKKEAMKKAAKTGSKIASKSSLMATLGPILISAIPIILIIVCTVGIISFILLMPGMVIENIKEMVKNFGDEWDNFFGANSTTFVNDDEINGVLDYLEKMGYDLLSYGFLTGYATAGENYDNGVQRKENGTISAAVSHYVKMYIVSDNYSYTLAGENIVTDTWYDALGKQVVKFVSGRIGEGWGQGLIHFYKEKIKDGEPQIGVKDGEIADIDGWGSKLEVDRKKKKLSIKTGWFKDYYTYNLDGWTGRYGMPLEFLLSVHLATQMPDLAYDMATSFNTRINMILHKANFKTDAGYLQDWVPADDLQVTKDNKYSYFAGKSEYINKGYILLKAVEDVVSRDVFAKSGYTVSKEQALSVLRLGVKSPLNCMNEKNKYKVIAQSFMSDSARL